MWRITQGRWLRITTIVLILVYVLISGILLSGTTWRQFDRRIVRLHITPGRSLLIEVIALNFSNDRVPNYVGPFGTTWESWQRWNAPSPSPLVPNTLRVTVLGVDTHTHTSPTLVRFSLSQHVLAELSVLCLLVWLVGILVLPYVRRSDRMHRSI